MAEQSKVGGSVLSQERHSPVLLPNFGNKTAPSDEGAKVLFVNCQLFSVLAGEEEDLLGFCFGLQEREGGFEPYIVEAD